MVTIEDIVHLEDGESVWYDKVEIEDGFVVAYNNDGLQYNKDVAYARSEVKKVEFGDEH